MKTILTHAGCVCLKSWNTPAHLPMCISVITTAVIRLTGMRAIIGDGATGLIITVHGIGDGVPIIRIGIIRTGATMAVIILIMAVITLTMDITDIMATLITIIIMVIMAVTGLTTTTTIIHRITTIHHLIMGRIIIGMFITASAASK